MALHDTNEEFLQDRYLGESARWVGRMIIGCSLYLRLTDRMKV